MDIGLLPVTGHRADIEALPGIADRHLPVVQALLLTRPLPWRRLPQPLRPLKQRE